MSFGNNVYNTLNGNNGTSFTPGISFGNASVGITYSNQIGYYHRIGSICFFTIYISLTNKGSSTGAARITGLPFNAGTTTRNLCVPSNLNLSANYTTFFFETEGGITNGLLNQTGDNVAATNLLDSDFSNNTIIVTSGFYFV